MSTLTYSDALTIIGGLSAPSKMPWFGWSLSAFNCKTGGKLQNVEGSVCEKCYAMKGNYRFTNVRTAHQRRLDALSHPLFTEAFVVVLKGLFDKTKTTYVLRGVKVKENRFRWMDSGDIQSVEHLKIINSIAKQTPYIQHWLPTKEASFVKEFLKSETISDNLTIRLSAPMVGQTFTKKPQGLNFSTVGVDNSPNNCVAYNQGGKCLDCNMCWDKTIDQTNYPLH